MALFKYHTALEIAQGITAYLNLDVGWTRGEAPVPEAAAIADDALEQGRG